MGLLKRGCWALETCWLCGVLFVGALRALHFEVAWALI